MSNNTTVDDSQLAGWFKPKVQVLSTACKRWLLRISEKMKT